MTSCVLELMSAQSALGALSWTMPWLKSRCSSPVISLTWAALRLRSGCPPKLASARLVEMPLHVVCTTMARVSGEVVAIVWRSARVWAACASRGPAVAAKTQPSTSRASATMDAAPVPVSCASARGTAPR